MSDLSSGPEPSTEYVFVVDEGFASRAATAVIRETLLRPPWTLIFAGLVVLAVGLILLFEGVNATAWIVIGVIAFCVLLVPLVHRTTRKQLAATLPTGGRIAVRYFERSLWMSTPLVSSEMDYSLFDLVRVRGDVALFRMRTSKTYSIAPKQVVPDDVLARIRPIIEART